jgi:hypothetical protein
MWSWAALTLSEASWGDSTRSEAAASPPHGAPRTSRLTGRVVLA